MKDFAIVVDVYNEQLDKYEEKTAATYSAATKKLVLSDWLLEDSSIDVIRLTDYENQYFIMIYIK